MYGCLVHDCGQVQLDRLPMDLGDIEMVTQGLGDAVLTSNREGTKTFRHNLIYRGCGGNFGITTETAGYDFIENISSLAKAYKPNECMDSFGICGNYGKNPIPLDRIRVVGNVGYQPRDISAWRPNMRLISYNGAIRNGQAVVKDNYLMGAANGLALSLWRDIEIAGNTIWATKMLVQLDIPKESATPENLRGYRFDGNTYVDNGGTGIFPGTEGPAPAAFGAWQARGFDRNGKLDPGKGGRPAGTKIFMFPNRYEKGRGHVAVFNWDGAGTVSVDLGSVLAAGQTFRVYNCLDIRRTIAEARPVLTGTFAGGPVSLPLRHDPLSPDFDAFLVLPEPPPPR